MFLVLRGKKIPKLVGRFIFNPVVSITKVFVHDLLLLRISCTVSINEALCAYSNSQIQVQDFAVLVSKPTFD